MSTELSELTELDVDLNAHVPCELGIPLDWPVTKPWYGDPDPECDEPATWRCYSKCGCVANACAGHYVFVRLFSQLCKTTSWVCPEHEPGPVTVDPNKEVWRKL